MGIFFAICCLFCAAFNDILFKRFSGTRGGRGFFLALIGLVWLLSQIWWLEDSNGQFRANCFYGILSGIFSVAANLLLIEAMQRQSAGICSTIYRMNLVFVVCGAAIFLGESLRWWQWLGVGVAVCSIGCFFSRKEIVQKKSAGLGLILAIAAAVLRALMGLTYKYGFEHGAASQAVIIINSFCWIVGGIVYGIWRREPLQLCFSSRFLKSGLFSGVLVGGIVYFMAAALKYGQASIVLPIAQMSFVITILLSVVFLQDRFSLQKKIGVLCGIGAILLLCLK